ncbi:hypothetical protein IOC61_02975 [Halomonas sp. KAO]|uniref:NUDIX hydrolase n=1 Tax=Halomonas sp. KAO TaxID=2783858 RepID=UPI00189C73F4|nr:NUDIX domain-containing protein [Halomonas sp. KAO]MBF7052278.1 hypothetical protein [Halomonas sp. KAO]
MDERVKLKLAFLNKNLKSVTDIGKAGQVTESVFIFFSIDLVGSTGIKKEAGGWIEILRHLFEASTTYARKDGYKLWKYRGDEALFYKEVVRGSDVAQELYSVYSVAERVNKDYEFLYQAGKDSPKVKAAMWISNVSRLPRGDYRDSSVEHVVNEIERKRGGVAVSLGDGQGESYLEFLGLNIDAGFRVAEISHPEVVAVSVELASIVSLIHGSDEVRSVGYRELKGVDSFFPYPVLWYSPNWCRLEQHWRQQFRLSSYEAAALIEGRAFDNELCEKTLKALGLGEQVGKLLNDFRDRVSVGDERLLEDNAKPSGFAERKVVVHCVAICFNNKSQVLLGRRQFKKGSPLSEKWEFGCAQLQDGMTFESALRQDYLYDFGIEIHSFHPRPISTYTVEGKDEQGVIFLARVGSGAEPIKNKHQEVGWFDLDSIDLRDEDCVPNFRENLELAEREYEVWVHG